MAQERGPKFTEIDPDAQAVFDKVYEKLNFVVDINVKLINATRQNQAAKLEKCNDKIKFLTDFDFLLLINDEVFLELDEQAQEILLLQELDRIKIDLEKDRISMEKPDIVTFSGIVKKYGIENVARANQLFDLTNEQNEEKLQEFIT